MAAIQWYFCSVRVGPSSGLIGSGVDRTAFDGTARIRCTFAERLHLCQNRCIISASTLSAPTIRLRYELETGHDGFLECLGPVYLPIRSPSIQKLLSDSTKQRRFVRIKMQIASLKPAWTLEMDFRRAFDVERCAEGPFTPDSHSSHALSWQ